MRKIFAVFLALIAVVSGCQESSMEPEEIDPEIDVCEVCNMGIAHEFYAAEIVSSNGDIFKFDDLGCMEEYTHIHEDEASAKKYVRDMETGEWVQLKDAFHAYDPEFWTPMANGVVSFKNRQRAEEYIHEQGRGRIYDYQNLAEHEWSWEE